MTAYKILAELDVTSIDDNTLVTRLVYDFVQTQRKEVFEENERLRVIVGDHDYYIDNQQYGQKLATILFAIDEIDISRCFIEVLTTNKNIEQEIGILSKSDNKYQKMSYSILSGEFVKRKGKIDQHAYSTNIPTKVNLANLNEQETYWLTESKTFCMYPWIHLNASPDGAAMPCCLWDYNYEMGSVKTHTIKELWNNDNWKNLRKNMMNDVESPGCRKCYGEEQAGFFSNRQSSNKHHGHHIDKVTSTLEDGTAQDFELTYWDIRFSNLCNLSCRSCGHIFSSSWYQDQAKLAGPEWAKNNKPLFWAGQHKTDMLDQLMEHIDHVEQIYFAGGEPLMMDEHYHILEELERRKKFNVRLVYNTNFTQTKLKDRYVFDYWKKFDSVSVGASLDAMGPRAEYIRKGTKWSVVEANRRLMMEICPDVDFYISPTLSIQNALHIPDFHKDWVEKGLLKPKDLNVNLLQDPEWLRVDIAPQHYKDKIKAKYEEHLKWLRPLDKFERATQGFESAIKFLEGNNQDQLPKFWERMSALDKIRNEHWQDFIPELHELTK